MDMANTKNNVGLMGHESDEARFLLRVWHEILRARASFPSPELSAVALMEEVGELAKALLDESKDRVYAEAVQVACMAFRVAVEGDPATKPHRLRKGLEVWD